MSEKRHVTGNKFFLFDGLGSNEKLLPNEAEFSKDDGFVIVSDVLVKYPKGDAIEVEVTDLELIDSVDLILSKSPDLVRSLNKDLLGTLKSLGYELEKEFDINVDMGKVYQSLPRFKDFIDMVSLGVVVGMGYTSALGFPYKVFYLSPRVGKSNIYVRTTNRGRMFKNIPVITEVTRSQINNAMNLFYADFLANVVKKTGGDYFLYFLKTMPDQAAVRNIHDIASNESEEPLDVARALVDNAYDPQFVRKMESKLGTKKFQLAVTLAKLIK